MLTLLLVVQATSAAAAPTIGSAILTALDLLVLALVVLEYRHLRRRSPSEARTAPAARR